MTRIMRYWDRQWALGRDCLIASPAFGHRLVMWFGFLDFIVFYGPCLWRIRRFVFVPLAHQCLCDFVPYDAHHAPSEQTVGLLAATVVHGSGICLAPNALLGFDALPSGRSYTARVGYFWILNVIMSMSMSLTLTLTFFLDITLLCFVVSAQQCL